MIEHGTTVSCFCAIPLTADGVCILCYRPVEQLALTEYPERWEDALDAPCCTESCPLD